MKNVLLVFAGGGIGSVLRYLTIVGMARMCRGSEFPWSILAANLAGSFILGFLFGLPAMRAKDSAAWLFLATGVLGGYTTFSTMSNDSLQLWQNGHGWLALLNSAGSSLIGILAAAVGWRTAAAFAA